MLRITEIDYDKRNKTMAVQYEDGTSRTYLNVSPVAFCACVSAPNVPAYLYKYIEPVYIRSHVTQSAQEGQLIDSLASSVTSCL